MKTRGITLKALYEGIQNVQRQLDKLTAILAEKEELSDEALEALQEAREAGSGEAYSSGRSGRIRRTSIPCPIGARPCTFFGVPRTFCSVHAKPFVPVRGASPQVILLEGR